MILPFTTHIAGKPTYFVEKIWKGIKGEISRDLYFEITKNKSPEELTKQYTINGEVYDKIKPKIHTLRNDVYNIWCPGTLIQFFTKDSNLEPFQFAPVLPVVSTQEVFMTYSHSNLIQISIDGRELFSYTERWEFALNDGFDCWDDFFNYFYPKIQQSDDKCYKPKLIHWTNLKY